MGWVRVKGWRPLFFNLQNTFQTNPIKIGFYSTYLEFTYILHHVRRSILPTITNSQMDIHDSRVLMGYSTRHTNRSQMFTTLPSSKYPSWVLILRILDSHGGNSDGPGQRNSYFTVTPNRRKLETVEKIVTVGHSGTNWDPLSMSERLCERSRHFTLLVVLDRRERVSR